VNIFFDVKLTGEPGRLDIVSIALVDEKDHATYAVSEEHVPKRCSEFVKTEVLPHVERELAISPERIKLQLAEFLQGRVHHEQLEFWGLRAWSGWTAICGLMSDARGRLPMWIPEGYSELLSMWDRRLPGRPGRPKRRHALDEARFAKRFFALVTGGDHDQTVDDRPSE
jgi:hypothetical protein